MADFKKNYTKVTLGNNSVRHRVTIEDNLETIKGSTEARKRFFAILDMLLTTPDLATVGSAQVCDRAALIHTGERWTFQMEALTDGDLGAS